MSGMIYQSASGDSRGGLQVNGNRRGSPKLTPLTRFVDAKQKINAIFKEVQAYVDKLNDVMLELSKEYQFVSADVQLQTCRCKESVQTLREMLSRDHMKVVFFGRTSNGKSTVVNAMLQAKVLPTGIGHTTRCFVQVEGSEKGDKYFTVEGSETQMNVESLDDIASALAGQHEHMGEDTMVRLYWPKTDSKLLQNDVVLVDSPGVDVTPEFDSWIDKHCLDADVFVFVANAEATLTQAEKSFFVRVREKVSKPNIFILNNRWDASAAEPDMVEKVRQQHMAQFSRLLVDDMQLCSHDDAKDRIYFVSAREILTQRLKEKGITTPTSFAAEGHVERAMQFRDFERQFELCISQSAILTKFMAHLQRGRDLMSQLSEVTDHVLNETNAKKHKVSLTHQDKLTELRQSQAALSQFLSKYREHVLSSLSQEVQLKVSSDFSEEIRRLDYIIDSYNKPFTDDPNFVETYKKQLIDFIDGMITQRLVDRCTGGLHARIQGVERDMVAGVSALLPTDYVGKASEVLHYRDPFKFSISIHCHVLMEDFQEDLEFRFSLGLTNIIRRVYAFTRQRQSTASNPTRSLQTRSYDDSTLIGGNKMSRSLNSSARSSSEQSLASNAGTLMDMDETIFRSVVLSSAAYVANGGVGLLVIAGLIYRSVGWKPILIGGVVYGGLYTYERLRWNLQAKEQQFKRQLRQHLSWKLRTLANTYTANCDSQVTREVQEVLARLHNAATECHQHMKSEVDRFSKEVLELDKVAKELAHTKGQNTFIRSDMDNFESKYLISD